MKNNLNEANPMSGKIFICFDEYYPVDEYNAFLVAAKNNKVSFEEFIRVRPPFNRFIMIDPKDTPTFVDFDKGTSSDIKWLVSTVKPRRPDEAYYLRRRPGQDIRFWIYATPK